MQKNHIFTKLGITNSKLGITFCKIRNPHRKLGIIVSKNFRGFAAKGIFYSMIFRDGPVIFLFFRNTLM